MKEAIRRTLEQGMLGYEERLQQMMQQIESMAPEQIDQLLERLTQKLAEEGYVNLTPEAPRVGHGNGQREQQIRVEVTDKALDFLGYKTLKDLLASLGKSSFGRHDTRATNSATR